MIRRLKSKIREADAAAGRPERFGGRELQPVPLFFGREEQRLLLRFSSFESRSRKQSLTEPPARKTPVDLRLKFLISDSSLVLYTFADSWLRVQEGTRDPEPAEAAEVRAAQLSTEQDTADDRERQERSRLAARTVGAWLKPWVTLLAPEIAAIDEELTDLGLTTAGTLPQYDERWERLLKLIRTHLRDGENWCDDERLIIFTGYKTTLDYLKLRLETEFRDNGSAIRVLFGDPAARDNRQSIINAFNDPANPVRVRVATDVACEGINLQETARLLLHFDIPWNPARLEQRNGRLDRHGQARDVTVFHYASDDDADVRFCARIAEKVNEIREVLGNLVSTSLAAQTGGNVRSSAHGRSSASRALRPVCRSKSRQPTFRIWEPCTRRLQTACAMATCPRTNDLSITGSTHPASFSQQLAAWGIPAGMYLGARAISPSTRPHSGDSPCGSKAGFNCALTSWARSTIPTSRRATKPSPLQLMASSLESPEPATNKHRCGLCSNYEAYPPHSTQGAFGAGCSCKQDRTS